MSINKESTSDEICNFLKQNGFIKSENILSNFKKENIKGNEILFLEADDFIQLGFKFHKKITKTLEEIKNNQKEILVFNENINQQSTNEDVYHFLKNEIKLEENVLKNFQDKNGQKLKELNYENLKELGLKLGERRKLLKYLKSYDNTKEISINEITVNSTKEEVCLFLENRFKLNEDSLKLIKEYDINGEGFFNLCEDDFEELNILDINIQKSILSYINKNKPRNEIVIENTENTIEKNIVITNMETIEEENFIEENFKHYLLIDILEYETSEEDINKCPSNNLQEFIQLCEDMNINNEDNCAKIDFDQADEIKLKTATIWGTKEGLFEFFEKRKMNKTKEYFNNDKIGTGIILAIKEDKSLAYIIIWPGKMNYIYKHYDEPQKSLLLSFVRIGFSLSDNCVFCLSEKQKEEFDFESTNELYNVNAFQITIGEVKFNIDIEDYFKLENNININFDSNEIDGNINNIKLNGNSVFLYVQTDEKINVEKNNKVSSNNINYNFENIHFHETFELSEGNFYKFLKRFNQYSNLIQEKKYIDFYKFTERRLNEIKDNYHKVFSNLSSINFKNIKCELCLKMKKIEKYNYSRDKNIFSLNKKEKEQIFFYNCNKHSFHLLHMSCLCEVKNNDLFNCIYNNYKFLIHDQEIKYENIIDYIKEELIKNNNNKIINEKIEENIKNLKNKKIKNIKKIIKEIQTQIDEFINNNKKEILNEDKIYKETEENQTKLKKSIIAQINEEFNKKLATISEWIEFIKVQPNENKTDLLFTYNIYKQYSPNTQVKLFTFYPYNNEEKYILKFKDSKKWEEDEFGNYFLNDNNGGLLVKKMKIISK